jgi:hypothetical protein
MKIEIEQKITFAMAIASSSPGGGVSNSSPRFNSPNLTKDHTGLAKYSC